MWDLVNAASKAVRAFVDDVTEYETTSTYNSSTIQRAVGGDHIFIADPDGQMLYGGFVWLHATDLKNAINRIKAELT